MLVWLGFDIHPGTWVRCRCAKFDTDRIRWSFGGNRLQIKAEMRLMTDIGTALKNVAALFAQPITSLPSLAMKQELLTTLLENEQSRLLVWLFPLDHERRHILPMRASHRGPSDVCYCHY